MSTCAWCDINIGPDHPRHMLEHDRKTLEYCSADHRRRWVSFQGVEDCMRLQVGAARTWILLGLLADLPERWEERLLTAFPDVMKPIASAPAWFQPEESGVLI
jgi:hypothetical protein